MKKKIYLTLLESFNFPEHVKEIFLQEDNEIDAWEKLTTTRDLLAVALAINIEQEDARACYFCLLRENRKLITHEEAKRAMEKFYLYTINELSLHSLKAGASELTRIIDREKKRDFMIEAIHVTMDLNCTPGEILVPLELLENARKEKGLDSGEEVHARIIKKILFYPVMKTWSRAETNYLGRMKTHAMIDLIKGRLDG
jgi:hypothetical protein